MTNGLIFFIFYLQIKIRKMKNTKVFSTLKKGFTLIEILLVIALIAILAGIVIFAINPAKQLAEGRNTQRRSDVNTIINSLHQYSIDHNGDLPGTLRLDDNCNNSALNEICRSGSSSCENLTDLSGTITANQTYLVSIPIDPNSSGNGTGYYASINSNGHLVVCAPLAERGASISITR